MLRPHVTTADLLRLHNKLTDYTFPTNVYKKGTDGAIAATTLPLTFTSATGDFLTGTDDNFDSTDPTIVLNIPERGFYDSTAIVSDTELTIDWMPGVTPSINIDSGRAYDYKTVAIGTSLRWSLGGWEEKLLMAYKMLVNTLCKRGIEPHTINDNDHAYSDSITYKAMELIATALVESPDDYWAMMGSHYRALYSSELDSVKAHYSGLTTVAPIYWERE